MDGSGMSKRRKTSRIRRGLDEDDDAPSAPSGLGAAGDGERSRGGVPANRTTGAAEKRMRGTERDRKKISKKSSFYPYYYCYKLGVQITTTHVFSGRTGVAYYHGMFKEPLRASAIHTCVAKFRRCSHESCERRPIFNVEGSKTAAYCKEHAHEGMVDVVHKRCSHDSCKRRPNFNVEGSQRAVYCKQHAEDGMVNVFSKRCLNDSCERQPAFNMEGSKRAVYCKQHAEDGMVDVHNKVCSYGSCKSRPHFNAEGSKTASRCRQHAEKCMVYVFGRRCLNDSCTKHPTFNFVGSKKAAYCKQHAEESMVNVLRKLCSHDSCTKKPSWGTSMNCAPTVCVSHKNDLSGGLVLSFRTKCKLASCGKESRWGLDGKQPTHCRDHGPLTEGLVRTVGLDRSEGGYRTSSSRALKIPSHPVKTECLF